MRLHLMAATLMALSTPVASGAQERITRAQAIESALSRGGRLAIALADTAAARARFLGAHAFQNPAFSASYSKSTPQLHFIAELPVDLPGLRNARIASASAGLRAASYRFQFERAAARLDADTTYTRAQAVAAHARLSHRNAEVADTLLRMAVARRDAGDASDLEVELARVNAGQEHNLASADSAELTGALIDLQTAMGIALPTATLIPADTLSLPDTIQESSTDRTPLQIAAGFEDVQAATRNLSAEHRAVWGSPSLMGGIETRDPSGSETGILPTFGITLPLPLLNRNKAGIAQATAELARARAELSVLQIEHAAMVLRMRRQREAAYARATRDKTLLESANRVASMSVTAYRAGAFPLSNVLEAQRSAREILRQYVDDVADIWIADAALEVLTLTPAR